MALKKTEDQFKGGSRGNNNYETLVWPAAEKLAD